MMKMNISERGQESGVRRQEKIGPAFSWLLAPVSCLLACVLGCITRPQNPAATQPATAIDPQFAQPAHWLQQPPTASVNDADFQRLWNAASDVARDYGFKLDRLDMRGGVLTTDPRVSPQFFEIWRGDAGTPQAWVESSIAAVRRTLRFEFSRDESTGVTTVSPKVLVERQAQADRRVTSVVQYRTAVSPAAVAERGSRERDAGVEIPTKYWYATGRDTELEEKLAGEIGRRVQNSKNE